MLYKLLFHVDRQIITDDADPKSEFDSVGGLNLSVVAYYLLFIFVVSEIAIYGYAIKIRRRFPEIFNIGSQNRLWSLLINVFPIHFSILEKMLVNIKLEYLRYKLRNVFNPQSDEIEKELLVAHNTNIAEHHSTTPPNKNAAQYP